LARQQGLHAYEDRYRRVFSAGALHWNDPKPNQHLVEAMEGLPSQSHCVEFGCGEGYQARMLATGGHVVTAVDLSRTAIAKAIRETPKHLNIRFLVGDVTEADFPELSPSSFRLAVNIGCLHMMADDEDRAGHLGLVWRVLAHGGKALFQNGLDLDDVQPQSDEEAAQLPKMKEIRAMPAGSLSENTVCTSEGEKKIMLPLCPTCKMLSLEGYVRELIAHGFSVSSAKRVRGGNCAYEAVIVAEKR